MSIKWNYIRFGNLFDYENKSKIKAGDGLALGSYPFYTSSVELTKFLDQFQFDKTSLIFGTGGNASIHYCDNRFSVSTDCLVAFAKDETKVYPKYVFYYLSGNINLLEEGFKGAGLKHISKGYINEIQIPLPPLATQKRIAEILDAADALRRKDQELLKKYDELAQAIFIDMFGDPVKNEKGWDVNKGRDVVKVLGGAAFKSTDYKDDGIPLIRIGTINKGYFDKSQIVFLPSDFAITHERYIVKPKDLLITLTGTVGKDDYGNVYVMEDHFDQYLLNQRVAKLIVKQDYLMTRFFEFLLKQKEVKAELTGVSRGVRQANISNEDIYNLDVISPPMALQNDFVERINNVYGLMETSTNSSLVSDILFNSLIQKAFNGELVS